MYLLFNLALPLALGIALAVLIVSVRALIHNRRRQRPAGEPPEALEAFGVDISMWPSRAPRNGSTHDDETVR